MSENQKSYYAIIPANVRYDKELTANAKLLYGEITALCNEKGYCWATNGYFADRLECSQTSISRLIKQLANRGYVSIKTENNIVEQLISKNLNGFGFGNSVCDWCGIKTSVCHKHHYPIQKKDGGKETVNICPNCHNEYHYGYLTIFLNMNEKEINEIIEMRGTK